MPIQYANLAVVILFLGMFAGVGVYFAFKRKDAGEFMVANQSMPGWAVGMSMFGSYISSISFLANPAGAYKNNWMWAAFTLGTPVGLVFGSMVFCKFYRRAGHISAYEHLEHRFGAWARSYAVFTYLVLQMARTGTILYLLSQATLPLLGGDPVNGLWTARAIICAVGLLMTGLTVFGGIEAVVWMGVVQGVVLMAGPLICVVTILLRMPGGAGEVFHIAHQAGKFDLGIYSTNLIVPSFWLIFVTGLLEHLRNWGTDQSYIQRYISARTEQEARRSIWIAGLMYMPVGMFFFFIGSALFAFYTAQPDRLPAGMPADSVFPHFITHELPVGLGGLVIAAIFAASMDSNLNSMATLTLVDGYKRYLRPLAGDRESLVVLYGGTLFWGFASIAWGLGMTLKGGTSTIEFMANVSGLLAGGVLGLFLLGIIWRRVTGGVALVATVLGVLVICWMTLSRWTSVWPAQWVAYRSPVHEIAAGFVGTMVILAVGVGLTWLNTLLGVPSSDDAFVPASPRGLDSIPDPITRRDGETNEQFRPGEALVTSIPNLSAKLPATESRS